MRVRTGTEGFRRMLRRSLLYFNLLLAASLLLSYLSVYINPSFVSFPALFGLAYPYLAAANLVMVFFWLIRRKWYVLISLATIVIGIGNVHNFIRFKNHGIEVHHDLKLMSYNVRLFNFYEENERNSYSKMVNLMKKEDAGIYCIQEYFIKGNIRSGVQTLKESIGGRLNTHTKMVTTNSGNSYGIVTLSRYPVINKGDIVHPGSSSLTIYTDIVVDTDTFRVYNNHLQSFRLRRMERSLISELSDDVQNHSVSRIVALYRSLARGFSERSRQVARVSKHIRTSPYPVIVAGDFNDTPVSYTYRKMRRGLSDAFVEAGYGAGFTYRGKYPPNRIDYVLYTDELQCTDFDIVKVKYSDHYPVITYFRRVD